MVCLIFVGIVKNVLTEYGVGLLIGMLVFGIIGYNILIDLQIIKINKIDLPPLEIEEEKGSDLMKHIEIRP
jgi:hypothetical protein